jgi:hypothetical protein
LGSLSLFWLGLGSDFIGDFGGSTREKYVGHGLIESHHKNGLISDFLKFSHFLGFHRFGAI